MSESLVKRLEYLGIADMDYLSARALLINGLTHTGLSKGAEAFEKLFKLFLIIEAKITQNKHLTHQELKQYEHKLVKLFKLTASKVPNLNYDNTVEEYFQQLENAYKIRYPESWIEAKFINDLENLDKFYSIFRNIVTENFPPEEHEKTKLFGTFIMKAYSKVVVDYITDHGGMSPKQVLAKNNNHFAEFNIDVSKLL